MKHYIYGVLCGGVLATTLWLSGNNTSWDSVFPQSTSREGNVQSTLPADSSVDIATSPPTTSDLYRATKPLGHLNRFTVDKQAEPPESGTDPAALTCVGTAFGASCLDKDGEWTLYTPENSQLSAAIIVDVAVCSNETVVFAHASGIDILRGNRWTAISTETLDTTAAVTVVECLADGSIWVGYEDGLSQFDGSNWNHFDLAVLGTTTSGPRSMAGDSQSHLWVLTSHSIAQFDGRNWTTYAPGAGLPDQETRLTGIAIGDNDRPRARDGEFNRSLRFTGEQWVVRDVDQPAGVTGFAIDARDSEWVGSDGGGAWVYSQGGAVVQDSDSSNLTSNQVLAIATDESGRTWLGTSWGVNVFDGQEWTAYHMHTADLPDNRIMAIDVAGEGPELPDPMQKESGVLVGSLLRTGEPFADTLVEVCADSLGSARRGPSPCINQSEFYAAITDVDGRFTLTDLPTGRYKLAFLNDGEWTHLEELPAPPLSRVLVAPGETTNIGSLDITPLPSP
ncbi:MAG: hypothetical protein AB4050_14095 [Synechococcus sp.]